MPPWRNFFSFSAVSVTIVAVGTSLLGYGPIWEGRPSWVFPCSLFLLAAVLWWVNARLEFKAERGKDALDQVLARFGQRQIEGNGESGAVEDYRPLTTAEIRSRVATVASKMRQMETAFNHARDRLLYRDDRNNWDQFTNQLLAQSREQWNRWSAELRPEATALWNEMRRRLYGAPPYPRDANLDSVALDHGMLAGVSPLNEAALALEDLARQLP